MKNNIFKTPAEKLCDIGKNSLEESEILNNEIDRLEEDLKPKKNEQINKITKNFERFNKMISDNEDIILESSNLMNMVDEVYAKLGKLKSHIN